MVLDGLRDRLSFESGDRTIEFVEPPARGITGNVVILVAIGGVLGLVASSIGLLDPEGWKWLPLGVILFLLGANPIITLPKFWEAITVILMYANIFAYIIIYEPGSMGNAFLVAFTLLMLIVIFEFPRRFNLK